MKTVFKFGGDFILNNRSSYNTKQKEELLEYLKSLKGNHVTVNDIHKYSLSKNMKIGVTTIYRHLEKFVESGEVAKISIDGTSSAYFEYIGNHSNHTNTNCFHLKCEKCNKLTHLHCNGLVQITKHISESHGFNLNSLKTVFYGVCNLCQKKL